MNRLKYKTKAVWHKLLIFLHIRKVSKEPAIDSLLKVLPVIMASTIIMGAIRWLSKAKHKPYLWITSPNGKHYKFPLYQSLRILRRRKDWEVAEVEPVITEWQMIKRILGVK